LAGLEFGDESRVDSWLEIVKSRGFHHVPEETSSASKDVAPYEMTRDAYNSMFGPTVGDR
jgi:hypothetical protein